MPKTAMLIVAMAGAVAGVRTLRRAVRHAGRARPSILLVTLDTTRADAIGPDAPGIELLPSTRWRRAGAVPAGVCHRARDAAIAQLDHDRPVSGRSRHPRERAVLDKRHPVLAERLKAAGYRTAGFVSSFVLSRRFGLSAASTSSTTSRSRAPTNGRLLDTTGRALAYLSGTSAQPLFMWVHYFDPHTPYTPPEPFRSRYAFKPYLGEVAAMDQQLGRLVQAFESAAPGPVAMSRRGSRRGPGRSRRDAARQPPLPVDDARAARRARPGVTPD